jgi:hypothetical protein
MLNGVKHLIQKGETLPSGLSDTTFGTTPISLSTPVGQTNHPAKKYLENGCFAHTTPIAPRAYYLTHVQWGFAIPIPTTDTKSDTNPRKY